MTSNQRNKQLLNKQKPYNKIYEEEIQMQLIQNSPRSKPLCCPTEHRQHYYILEDNKQQAQIPAERRKRDQLPLQKPFDQKIITMNGQTFKLVENNPKAAKPSKSKLPTMLVSCHRCKTVQAVPGTADIFDCGVCNIRNQCVPIYAILRCYSCNAKVLYSVGSSQFIKCTKCTAVNQIPSNVRKARGASNVNQDYQVFFNKNQMQTQQKANPYVRYNQESQLQQLLSEGQIQKKYPDL